MYPEQKLPSYHQNLVRAKDKTMQKSNNSTRENVNTPSDHGHSSYECELLLCPRPVGGH